MLAGAPMIGTLAIGACATGAFVGGRIGDFVGDSTGDFVGGRIGAFVGAFVGSRKGALVGETMGALVGSRSGALVGETMGALVGSRIGALVGETMGAFVGSLTGVLVEAIAGPGTGASVYWFTSMAEIFGRSTAGTVSLNLRVKNPSETTTGETTLVMALNATPPPRATMSIASKDKDWDSSTLTSNNRLLGSVWLEEHDQRTSLRDARDH
jgi:hypothetical protein